jgi:hypothetical protein
MTSKAPSQTTQTTKVELPKWVDDAAQGNYRLAQQIANKPLVQYGGKRVADASDMTKMGYDWLVKNVGKTDPMYEQAYTTQGEASDLYKKAAGPLDVNNYLNPFTDEVEKNSIRNATESLGLQQQGLSDAARKAKAFGGSRFATQAGVLGAKGAQDIGDLSAQLRLQGYDKATADMLAHRQLMQGSATGLLNTAEGVIKNAGARQTSVLADVSALAGAGKDDEARTQRKIDADMGKFDEANNYDMTRLNTLMAALGMSPYGKTETAKKTGTSEQGGTDWASTGLGIAKLLPTLLPFLSGLSDRRDKTDVKKIGGKNKFDLPLYSYRYKGDPKTYPKVVGPMAQDVEKKYPGVVKEIGGHKTVPIGMLTSA